jgi:hypothetical protein
MAKRDELKKQIQLREEIYSQVSPKIITIYEEVKNDIKTRWKFVKFDFQEIHELFENTALEYKNFKVTNVSFWETLFEPFIQRATDNFIKNGQVIMPQSSKQTVNLTKDINNPSTVNRSAVFARDGGVCKRCGVKLELNTCHIHHILAKLKQGTNEVDNLITLCFDCHTLMPDHGFMRDRRSVSMGYGGSHRKPRTSYGESENFFDIVLGEKHSNFYIEYYIYHKLQQLINTRILGRAQQPFYFNAEVLWMNQIKDE